MPMTSTTQNNFKIRAVKNLYPGEAKAWWSEVMGDRIALSGLVGWPQERRTIEAWLEVANQPDVDMNVIYDGNDNSRLAYFWISDIKGHFGLLHFNFLSRALPQAIEIGKFVLNTLWSAGYQCVVGLTPKHMRNAVAYAQAVGGRIVCELPGACYWADTRIWETGVQTIFLPGCEENY